MKRVLLTGGGTAGHITPNIALINAFLAEGVEVSYIGAANSMEQRLIGDMGIPFYTVKVGKLRRYFDIKNLTDPFRVIAGVFESAKLIRRLKPDAVFAKGGFVSVPVVAGAWLSGVPAVLHESDRTPGLANRLCIPLCKNICTAFPETAQQLGKKAICTGLPIRDSLLSGNREKGLRIAGLAGKKPVVIVMGGSQGAGALNSAVRKAFDRLKEKFDVIHLCGADNLDPSMNNRSGYFQMEYADRELPDLFAASDIAFSRAGAGALFEFAALEKPVLAVPLPLTVSRGDQIDNAKYFEKHGWLKSIDESVLTPELLIRELTELYDSRAKYAEALKKADMAGAAARVKSVIGSAAKGGSNDGIKHK